MVKKLAIDWDASELRLVAAQCSGSNVKVTDARVIPIEDDVLKALTGQPWTVTAWKIPKP